MKKKAIRIFKKSLKTKSENGLAHLLKYYKVLKQHDTGTDILKCTWDFVLIRQGKMMDTKTNAFERRFYYSWFPRGRGRYAMPGRAT